MRAPFTTFPITRSERAGFFGTHQQKLFYCVSSFHSFHLILFHFSSLRGRKKMRACIFINSEEKETETDRDERVKSRCTCTAPPPSVSLYRSPFPPQTLIIS